MYLYLFITVDSMDVSCQPLQPKKSAITGNDNRQEDVCRQEEDNIQENDNNQEEDASKDECSSNEEDENILQYKCDKCNLSFQYKSWFKRHRKIHDPASIPCEYCPKIFKRKDSLKDHLYFHTGRRNFKCGECGRVFADRRNLTKHNYSKHIGVTEYCPHCKKGYGGKRELRYHIQRIHDKVNQYLCECGAG